MIDQRFQRRGYGRAGLRALVERMFAIPAATPSIRVSSGKIVPPRRSISRRASERPARS
ncbi:hypothetical protein [Mesorhizobium amorphae]|uniref:hypothetical protein n=1 Tax=Mesorhizobium amorphae TaxID=71433 RepID=UPI0021B3E85C|nr:hypothetical protein [Mesorhizobium amorphae]